MNAPRQAFIGAGSNLGDRVATLRAATRRLAAEPAITAMEVSSIYETDPLGVVEQPLFLNLVIGVETILTPEQLLETALRIEREFGRVRAERWGPRTLDLDLLAFEGEERASTSLQLPHPRMLQRRFVVAPLLELLNRPRYRRACWENLTASLSTANAEGKVRRLDDTQVET
jgi:2-amino-4-hydroxy-6-hydroxymethyldihydropteridine diphosphokinase